MNSRTMNNTYISGVIKWIRHYPDNHKVVFFLSNDHGSFYVEYMTDDQFTHPVGTTVLVEGALYSCFIKGRETTRIRASQVREI